MSEATINPERLARVEQCTLLKGAHSPPNNGDAIEFCVMEAVAFVVGEPWSDSPACASPTIAAFLRAWNDALSDADRNLLLKPLIAKLVGTAASEAVELRRGWMIIDWLIREFTPPWLRLAGLTAEADAFNAIAEVRDIASVEAAMRVITIAKSKAAAARDAARAAARAAARDAARDAAWAAAWAAAGKKLRPTVEELQLSAVHLIERLCETK